MKLFVAGDYYSFKPEDVSLGPELLGLKNQCDYSFINYEAPLVLSEKLLPIKSGPRLKQQLSSVDWLEKYQFDYLTLANNHVLDYGENNLLYTIEVLSKKFKVLGAGSWSDAYKPIILSHDGMTISVINLAELQFGVLCDDLDKARGVGCAWINHTSISNIILHAKSKSDYVILITHAGLENVEIPLPEWRNRYRELIDLGCDIVIGGHPHICQGFEKYKGKYIVYSLGNFCFNKAAPVKRDSWYRGEIAIVDIDANGLSLKLHGIQYKNNVIELIDDSGWNCEINRLNSLLEGAEYKRQVNKVSDMFIDYYYNQLSSSGCMRFDKHIIKSVLRKLLGKCNDANLLNTIQCESHRWCFTRALRKKCNNEKE